MLRLVDKKWFRTFSVSMALLHIFQISFPTSAMAMGSGPGQIEYQGVTSAVPTSENVNLFTGDFSYNIPLLDVDGYPVHLHYNQNVQMNQEASWVGLGWNLNVGAVNRNLRGLPDDFDGDELVTEKSIAANVVDGTREGHGIQALILGANWGTGAFESSYTGPGSESYGNASLGLAVPLLPGLVPFVKWPNESFGLGYTANSQTGLTVSASHGWGHAVTYGLLGIGYTKNKHNTETSYYNSRQGMTHTELNKSESWNASVNLSLIAQALILGFTGSAVNLPPLGAGLGSGTNGSTTIPVGTQHFSASNGLSRVSTGFSTSNAKGGTLLGMASYFRNKGTHFNMQVSDVLGSEELHAYGYFNLQNSTNMLLDVQDFDREWNGSYISETMPNISPSQATMDIFSASGAGLSSVYRPQRFDVGANHSKANVRVVSRKDIIKKKLWGLLSIVFLGLPEQKVEGNTTTSSFGGNTEWNEFLGKEFEHSEFGEVEISQGSVDYGGGVIFKNLGEKTEFDDELYEAYGGDEPAAFRISSPVWPLGAGPTFHSLDGTIITSTGLVTNPTDEYTNRKQPRQELFSFLTAEEASVGAIQTSILDYPLNTESQENIPSPSTVSRISGSRKAHHMSEVTVTKPDGKRYVYGIPAYNIKDAAWSFNVSGNAVDMDSRLVDYNSTDASADNENGRNNYFSKDETPGYASNFLLTALLSYDYADQTGNGPTPDDKGNYTRFNYSLTNSNYRWRVPYAVGEAAFNENFATDPDDDLGNFLYGEREDWYLHSVETKNSIVEFHLSERDDAVGVADEDGGMDIYNRKMKLDKIIVYDRQDREKLGGDPPIPKKTIEFVYDYSLCQGAPNSVGTNSGKLTLKELKIYTGKSKRGMLSPYLFSYNDATSSNNYDHGRTDIDRWGNYKPSDATNHNSEHPYSEQDGTLADQYARAWKLHQITTPTGAEINVSYESDDYALVQNKKAMNMYQIAGFGVDEGTTFSNSNVLFESTGQDVIEFNSFNRVYFQVENGTSSSDFITDYLKNSRGPYYFKCEVDLNDDDGFETVNGYFRAQGGALFENAGVVTDGGNTYGYINIRPVTMDVVQPDISDEVMDNLSLFTWLQPFGLFEDWLDRVLGEEITQAERINPIAIAGWNFTTLNLPELIYPFDVTDCETSSNPIQCLRLLSNTMGADLDALNFGQHGMLKNYEYSSTIDLSRSFVRLFDPDKAKKGGGARVSQIEVSDAWSDMTSSGESSTYGSKYTYNHSNGKSYGVASYEPLIGNDENPFRQRIEYQDVNVLAPDDNHYQESPVGESFYPTPLVGYSIVTVEPLSYSGVNKHKVGKREYEFYTAANFPVIVNKTELADYQQRVDPGDWPAFLFETFTPNLLANSQGFCIEVNDMHGKPKSVRSYSVRGNGDEPLYSTTTYKYKTDKDEEAGVYRPYNQALVHRKNNQKESTLIGMDCQIHIDHMASGGLTTTMSYKKSRNLGLFISWNTEFGVELNYEEYKSIALTKVINRYGILDEVSTTVNQRKVTKKDMHRDPETGQVLVTRIQNEYDDDVFAYIRPAYWAYDNMGPGFQNLSTTGEQLSASAGVVTVNDPSGNFNLGDELLVSVPGGTLKKCWVKARSSSNGTITIVDRDGALFPASSTQVELTVIRSGRKNLQSLPMEYRTSLESAFAGAKVLDTRAYEYSDEWGIYCDDFERCSSNYAVYHDDAGENILYPELGTDYTDCEVNEYQNMGERNPFIIGTQGAWRLTNEWYFDGERAKAQLSDPEDVRNDGYLLSYNAFWNHSGGGNWAITSSLSNWNTTFQNTKVDRDGKILERRFADGNYESTVYGYNQVARKYPVAVAYDARYRQIGFDGFEDYEYQSSIASPCGFMDHFSFKEGLIQALKTEASYDDLAVKRTTSYSHTGRYSLELGPKSIQSMSRKVGVCPNEENPLGPCEELTEPEITLQYTGDECVGAFQPMCGDYVISGWVYVPENEDYPLISFSDLGVESPAIHVVLDDCGTDETSDYATWTFLPSGPIINGWQQIKGVIQIHPGAVTGMNLEIALKNRQTSADEHIYFDDIRIQPLGSEMQAFVYDPIHSRLMAVLDNNNYATFIQYSQEGQAVRTIQETVQGYVTTRETYHNLKK